MDRRLRIKCLDAANMRVSARESEDYSDASRLTMGDKSALIRRDRIRMQFPLALGNHHSGSGISHDVRNHTGHIQHTVDPG